MPMASKVEKVKLSAMWAAYGDALGFMSELTDEGGLRSRIGDTQVKRPVPWRRRIGGRFGPTIDMPAGTYSDDTQLRLAVGRAIRGDGNFDVEAFARVELPVWLSYALGAGRSTRAAATSLGRENVSWMTNFYESEEQKYVASGGNGAAMRIQPHVWAARDRSHPETYLLDIIRNAVVTHGHPRAILGAVFHAMSIADALDNDLPPAPDRWRSYIRFFHKIPEIIHADRELRDLWLPLWEQKYLQKLSLALDDVATECLLDIDAAEALPVRDEGAYRDYVAKIGGTSSELRGSATKTAIIAAIVAWQFRGDIEAALLACANLLRSDTDSISSMVGAILGPSAIREPDGELQDREYLTAEALRLARIGDRIDESTFRYPDLLTWRAPKTQLDAIGKTNGKLLISGLGFAEPLAPEYTGKGKPTPIWQWVRLCYGQTVLIKRREGIASITPENLRREAVTEINPVAMRDQISLFEFRANQRDIPAMRTSNQGRSLTDNLHELTREAIESNFDPQVIGRHLLRLSEEEDGIERCIAYAAIIAKARRSRRDVARRDR
jgi:ADP-ribosylglycohydrolase